MNGVLLYLIACFPEFDDTLSETFVDNPNHDYDGDGLLDSEDCDDADPTVTRKITVYKDKDGDGFGVTNDALFICPGDRGEGYVDAQVRNGEEVFDCDDENPGINPDRPEECDDQDNDCDGVIDNYFGVDGDIFYLDADDDGYGDVTTAEYFCSGYEPDDYVSQVGDCDDVDSENFPGAIEYCDGVDNNCNGIVDEPTAVDVSIWFRDADQDGFGSEAVTVPACTIPSGYVEVGGDCDDNAPTTHQGASEYCNGVDDDCNGLIDESTALDAVLYHPDADGDSFGADLAGTLFCYPQTGYVTNNTDCNDSDATINPQATEVCNDIDDDCDGGVDDADPDDVPLYQIQYFVDPDGDQYGDPSQPTVTCPSYVNGVAETPIGFADNGLDCNESIVDSDGDGVPDGYEINPSASELCTENVDENCDGYTMVGAIDTPTYHADFDFDGHGNPEHAVQVCQQPYGYVLYDTDHEFDCDDTDADVFPSSLDPNSPTYATDLLAEELCNGKLDRCENDPNGGTQLLSNEIDDDGDGYVECTLDVSPSQWANGSEVIYGGDDCDDTRDDLFPEQVWYYDNDADGWGNPSIFQIDCQQPQGYVVQFPDCNDNHEYTFPGAAALTDPDACLTDVDGDDEADRLWSLCDPIIDVSESNLSITGGNYQYEIRNAGDLNGDGFDDTFVYNYNNNERGSITILLGGNFQDGSNFGPNDFDFELSTQSMRAMGSQMSALGDVDGDGLDDILVRGSTTYANMAPRVHLVLGSAIDPNNPVQAIESISIPFNPEDFEDNMHHSLGQVGDVDGDDVTDFLIGNWKDDGKAYLFLGGNLDTTLAEFNLSDADYVFLGSNMENAGHSVAIVGDVDGDGLDDLAFGAPQNDEGAVNGGKVYLVNAASLDPLNPTMSLVDADHHLIGVEDARQYAQVVGGDVDGDGLADVLISGMRYTLDRGKYAFLHFGSNFGPTSPTLNLDATDMDLTFTPYLSYGAIQNIAMGDADGDGLQDILLGEQTHGYSTLIFASSIPNMVSPYHVYDGDHLFSGQNLGHLVTFIDFDADGQEDVTLGGDNEFHVFLPCEN